MDQGKARLFEFIAALTDQPVANSEARAVHSSGGAAGGVVSESQGYQWQQGGCCCCCCCCCGGDGGGGGSGGGGGGGGGSGGHGRGGSGVHDFLGMWGITTSESWVWEPGVKSNVGAIHTDDSFRWLVTSLKGHVDLIWVDLLIHTELA